VHAIILDFEGNAFNTKDLPLKTLRRFSELAQDTIDLWADNEEDANITPRLQVPEGRETAPSRNVVDYIVYCMTRNKNAGKEVLGGIEGGNMFILWIKLLAACEAIKIPPTPSAI